MTLFCEKQSTLPREPASNPSFLTQETLPYNLFKHRHLKLGKPKNNRFKKESTVTITRVLLCSSAILLFLK